MQPLSLIKLSSRKLIPATLPTNTSMCRDSTVLYSTVHLPNRRRRRRSSIAALSV